MLQLDRHSLPILETIRQYDTFLESLKNVADMGCGTGEDIAWWATLENYDDLIILIVLQLIAILVN